ncbi:MAG: hypothetical protein GY873_40755 [Bosea sp.]|uniref:hypothetical protein n=1 Tax=Bosea sp. (in: a-proteobacteria) TaxID=1871050 RepID=UPI0012E35AA3|nr:hypothetical protein [Bosea sp. (in: a-proteobacteria)]
MRLYDRHGSSIRAITIIGQCMTKALFAGNSESVAYWALVHAYYRKTSLPQETRISLERLAAMIAIDPDEIS